MDELTSAARVIRHPEGIVELLLDAPDRGNALDLESAEALREAAHDVAANPGRAVLLRSAGRNFCVGGDLRAFAGRSGQAGTETEKGTGAYVEAVAQAAHAAVEQIHELPVPVVSAVQGAAAGAGIGLALVGDLVIAARSATFRLAYTAVGLSPDCGASWLLPRLVGPKRAMDLVLTNRALAAEQAEEWGLVSRVVEADALADAAFAVAAQLAAIPDGAARAVKRLIREAPDATLHDHLDDEARTIARLADGAPAQASMRAFLDSRSRPPQN